LCLCGCRFISPWRMLWRTRWRARFKSRYVSCSSDAMW
jgi:hypothetical protein